jgi:agmatine deiminase
MPDATTPAAADYRWPAEWEPHAATWLSWPHNAETWPADRLARVRGSFAAIVRALHANERVCINVGSDEMEDAARRLLSDEGVDVECGVRFERIPTDDAWLRDCGPIFLVRDRGPERDRALVDFRFDAWGGKYPPWARDDALPRRLAAILDLPRFASDLVLEGGSVDGNGRGTLLVTESCLLNPNRGAGRTRELLERALADFLGARSTLWLGGGIEGDDTDGHVDDVARFVDATTVVAAVEPDRADPNHAPLAANLRRLRGMRDADGKPLSVATLPMPPAIYAAGARLPASYANFYLANGVALVPIFGAASDERALAILRELLPGREIIGIESSDLVVGLGAIHCITQQEPAAGRED